MKNRLWLMFQPRLVTQPVVYELGRKFEVVTNIRQASVNEEIGIVSIEIDGEHSEVERAIEWLDFFFFYLETLEIYTIEG